MFPLEPDATVIGLAYKDEEVSAVKVALALPPESPIVIAPVPEPPKALVLVVP